MLSLIFLSHEKVLFPLNETSLEALFSILAFRSPLPTFKDFGSDKSVPNTLPAEDSFLGIANLFLDDYIGLLITLWDYFEINCLLEPFFKYEFLDKYLIEDVC